MKCKKNILLLFLFIGLLFFIVSCSSNINKNNSEPILIEEFQSDIEDEYVQGDSYTIQTGNQNTTNNQEGNTTNTKNNEKNNINDDTVIIIENNNNSKNTEDATESNISILDENGKEVKVTEDSIVSDKESIVDDLVLVHEDMEEGEDKTNEITIEATKNLSVEPIPIKGKLGQIFTMEAEETQIVYLFMELLPAKGQSTVEIGKDAIGMLINSINLINNAKNKIGKVNYIVIGVEIKKNDMWYFIASIGDIAAFVKGSIEMEELLKRITIKKGMRNIFNE